MQAGGNTGNASYQTAARQQFGTRGRLPSPVSAAAVNSRQSPFPTMEASFASPSDSPTASASAVATVTQHQSGVYPGQNHNPTSSYQNANQIRLQRQVSAPMATQHLPGISVFAFLIHKHKNSLQWFTISNENNIWFE